MKKIVATMVNGSGPVASFEGEHITKRELERFMRAIKLKHKQQIREYRKQKIIADNDRRREERKLEDVKRASNTETGSTNVKTSS